MNTQNNQVTMIEIQMSFSRGWNEVLKLSIPPAVWQMLTNHIADKHLCMIGESRGLWLQLAFDFGVESARKYENPELAP